MRPSLFLWASYKTHYIIHLNFELFIIRIKNLKSFCALFYDLNLDAVLECRLDGLLLVHLHEIHQPAPNPTVEFGYRRISRMVSTKFLI